MGRPLALWIVGLRWPDILLAPVGRWDGGRLRHTVRGRVALDPLCRALRLEGHEEEATVAGRGATWDGRRWDPLPLPAGPDRVLLVGHAPSRRPLGPRALEGRSGLRLAALAGMEGLASLLWTFETVNTPDRAAAEVLVARLRGRRVVVLGEEAHAHLEAVGLARAGAASVRRLPHPSGRSTALNGSRARWALTGLLAEEAHDARWLPGLVPPPGAPKQPRGATASPGERWRWLAGLGIAAAGARGVPWYHDADARVYSSPWRGARLLVAEDEGGRGSRWLVLPSDPTEPALQGHATDSADAMLLAEVEARRLGALDPWHALGAELAARSGRSLPAGDTAHEGGDGAAPVPPRGGNRRCA